MALASSVALLVLLVASALGWSASLRLATAPSFGLARRRAHTSLAAGTVAVGAGLVHIGAATMPAAGVPSWADLARASIVGLPLLAIWVVTIPRTWVVARRFRSADPLHWPGGRLRVELAAPELVVPFAAAAVAGFVVAVLPTSSVGTPLQAWVAAAGVLAAATVVAVRQRRRQDRVAQPAYVGASRMIRPHRRATDTPGSTGRSPSRAA